MPVFVAQGTRDHNSAPESADALVVELLRRDRERAVHYLILDGLDHGFFDASGTGYAEDVLAEFVEWATRGRPSRGVETRFLARDDDRRSHPRVRFFGLPPLAIAGVLAGAAGMAWSLRRGRHRTARITLAIVMGVLLFGLVCDLASWAWLAR
jgi:hypothetical protein